MSSSDPLNLHALNALVAGEGVAIRVRRRLQPAGGPGDKVFPPTYATGENHLRYAIETRRIDGRDMNTVLLDSVASQANRMEEALFEAWQDEALHFPVVGVDFSACERLGDLDQITALQAPHRIADAILRDSVTREGTLFRLTDEGKRFTNASLRDATGVYAICPTALVFGVWDSTGPKGGLGSKFARALAAEIVGVNAQTGAKVSSRLDPVGIQANVPVYASADGSDDWTVDPDAARKDKKGNSEPFSRRKADGKGNPSAVNHSNVAPSIDRNAGGVTFDYAEQTVVLSLPALRRLRFVHGVDGVALGAGRRDAEHAARVALAALAVAAIVHQAARGFDLRSRCLLVPEGPLALECVRPDGTVTALSIGVSDANALVDAAARDAATHGMGWTRAPLQLVPAQKLADLIRRSRDAAAIRGGTDAED